MKFKACASFWVCLITAVVLIIAGFIVPPIGVIDGSVITCLGILLAFGVVAQVPNIISMAKTTKITAGGTTIEVETRHKSKEQEVNGNNQ